MIQFNNMEKLEIIDLSAAYHIKKEKKDLVVLRHLNLTINSNEFVVIVGKSGCGKTTLLKCIAGFQVYAGKILKDGVDIENIKTKDRNLSYVTQYNRLFPMKTVFDNIAFPLKMANASYDEINTRVEEIAKLLNIELLLTRKPRQLSVGQQQRVCIAKALIKEADIVLMDEPFSGQDVPLREELCNILKDVSKKSNSTFIYVTHDSNEALKLADKIVVIGDNGKIEQVGTTSDIILKPKNNFVKEMFKDSNVLSRDMVNKND